MQNLKLISTIVLDIINVTDGRWCKSIPLPQLVSYSAEKWSRDMNRIPQNLVLCRMTVSVSENAFNTWTTDTSATAIAVLTQSNRAKNVKLISADQ